MPTLLRQLKSLNRDIAERIFFIDADMEICSSLEEKRDAIKKKIDERRSKKNKR